MTFPTDTTTPPRTNVLIIDDDDSFRGLLQLQLAAEGWHVVEAKDGRTGLSLCRTSSPAAVLLDLGLPDADGIELLQEIRRLRAETPILVLSSSDAEATKVAALEAGADDYMVKPIGVRELTARIRVRLRANNDGRTILAQAGGLVLNQDRRTVTVRGTHVILTRKEFALLQCLVEHAGQALPFKVLLERVWEAQADAQVLRVYVRALRKKIEEDPDRPKLIVSERGFGYSFNASGR